LPLTGLAADVAMAGSSSVRPGSIGVRRRTLAVRAFDDEAMMIGFELVAGEQLEQAIECLLADPRAAYLHVHFAAPGCYAARVERC